MVLKKRKQLFSYIVFWATSKSFFLTKYTYFLKFGSTLKYVSFEIDSFHDSDKTVSYVLTLLFVHRWSAIAARLPGRTDNEIKNYWNTHIRKRLLRMGIDPVTHSPRLDLLDISSILSSSLYNPSQMNNISRMFGVQPFVNPELLRLASSIMSSQRDQNPNLLLQSLQENQLCQNQIPQLVQVQSNQLQAPIQENINPTTCTTMSSPCVPFHSEAQPQFEDSNVDQFPSNFNNFSSSNCQLTEWQTNGMPSNFTDEDYVPLPNYNYYGSDQTIMDPSETSTFQSNNSNQNFSFASVLSTPSSSPTPLNSNSTYINSSSTEDERESYCSNMLKFEIQDLLDVNEFM